MDLTLLILKVLLLINVNEVTSYTISNADSLYTALTFGYNNRVRPSGTTAVTVRFNLLSVNKLSIQNQQFSATGWFDVTWTDSRLAWTPGSYGNINEIFLDYSYCWNPKLIVDNRLDDVDILSNSALTFRASYGGQVDWNPSGAFDVYCSMDITYYPFDTQTCYLNVKSWSYDSSSVSLSFAATGIDTNQFSENDEWELLSTTMTSDDVTQNSLTYSKLKFGFKLKRRSSTLLLNLLLTLIFTSFLGMCVFLIPAECESKLGFSVAILLAEVMLLNIVAVDMPTSGINTSILGMFLLATVILSVLESLMTIIVLKLFYNKNKPVTENAERLCSILYVITCKRKRNSGNKRGNTDLETESVESPQSVEAPPDFKNTIQTINRPPEFKPSLKRKPSIKSISPDCSFAASRNGDFQGTVQPSKAWSDGVGICGGRITDQKYIWEDIACAVDRFCFGVFFVLRLIFTIVFMVVLAFFGN